MKIIVITLSRRTFIEKQWYSILKVSDNTMNITIDDTSIYFIGLFS